MPQQKKICLQKLHFKFLELKNCIWGTRFQVPESFAALVDGIEYINSVGDSLWEMANNTWYTVHHGGRWYKVHK